MRTPHVRLAPQKNWSRFFKFVCLAAANQTKIYLRDSVGAVGQLVVVPSLIVLLLLLKV